MKKILVGLFIIIAGLLFRIDFEKLEQRLDAISSNPNPLVRHFSPTWRSLKKIIDVPYIVYGSFLTNDIPTYEISLARNDRINLLNFLPDYPEEARLTEEFKDTVKAEFRFGNYSTRDAKIRYRGVSPNHWNAIKKSWHIRLPAEEPLGSREEYRFFIGEDKGWTKAFLWEHLAKKLGIMAPEAEPARLAVNKKDMGLYVLMESWEESFLERYKKQLGPIFSNKNTTTRNVDLWRSSSISEWYNRFDDLKPAEDFPEVTYFISLVSGARDKTFAESIPHILDMETFYRWILATALAGDFGVGNIANLNFYFNSASGKFEPIFFDASPVKIEDAVDVHAHRLVNRVLGSEPFRSDFESVMRSYVMNLKNLEDDLNFYDVETKRIRPALYQDWTKIQTTYEARKQIANERAIYKSNFLALRNMLEKDGHLKYTFAEEKYPLEREVFDEKRFRSFLAVVQSRNEFLASHPQFTAGADPRTVILLPGTYSFTDDIIMPAGIETIIREGVTIFMGPGASLVAYGPVQARGTSMAPIRMKPSQEKSPWGIFALVNANKLSTFTNIYLEGGKDDTVNGIYFSGMLSAHRSPIVFDRGIIREAGADDGIHTLHAQANITNSRFIHNFADAIDIDYAEGDSKLADNTFTVSQTHDSNGDAMDISFSAIEISNNKVESCGDKGISVGEASTPTIRNNSIYKCSVGIAVKDGSYAVIENVNLRYNKVGIALYRKKPHFTDGGSAEVRNSVIWNNDEEVTLDEFSKIIIKNSVVEGGYPGENISSELLTSAKTL